MLPFHDPQLIRRIELELRPKAERTRALRESRRPGPPARRRWLAAVAARLVAPLALRPTRSPAASAALVTPLPPPRDADPVEPEGRCCA